MDDSAGMCTRPLALPLFVGIALLGCGSRTDLVESFGGPTGAGDAGSGAVGADAGATKDASSAGDADATVQAAATLDGSSTDDRDPADAATCVTIDLSMYDVSCETASDCTYIAVGTICSDGCACGDAAVNVAGRAQYQQALSTLPPQPVCNCPNEPALQCVNGQCVVPLPTPE